MKKYVLQILTLVAAALTFSQCSDDSYTEKYTDPSRVSTSSVDKLMTGTLRAGFDFVTPNYWRFFGHDNQGIGALSQNWGMPLGSSLYEGGYAPYRDDGDWNTYLTTLIQFKATEKLYNELSDNERNTFKPYYLCAKAFMYQTMLQALDVMGGSTDGKGGLPYSEAGLLSVTGEILYPNLDPAPQLYQEIIDELGTINNEIAGLQSFISPNSDFINDGSQDKWQRYVNSIRLRAAIRVSSQGDLASVGQNAIKEILTSPDAHPVVTSADNMIKVVNRGDGDFNWSRLEGVTDGIDNGNWNATRTASWPMLKALGLQTNDSKATASADPRLPLIYDTRKDGAETYRGVELAPGKSESDYDDFSGSTHPPYSWINHRSFIENMNIAGYVVTPSEIYFYKAEAIKRGLISGDAKAEFVNGVVESIKLYADINATAQPRNSLKDEDAALSPPVNTDLSTAEAFANSIWKDNLDCIYEQLWLHCGIINVVESWNTIRRTGVPQLYYPTVMSSKSPTVPQRLIIPQDERTYNITIRDAKIDADPRTGYQVVPFWAIKVQ